MAFARDSYTAGSSQTDFTITFSYLDVDHVQVELNGTLQAVDTNYTVIGGGAVIRFNSGLTSGDQVVITRLTSRGSRLVDYTVPGVLTESDLDTDSLQGFYMAQEAIDRAALSLGLDSTGNWDATNLRIKNLATPTAASDAATKAYIDSQVISAGNVPVPSDPAEDDYTLRADGGTYSWERGMPTPADPADDGKLLRASGGEADWATPGTGSIPPIPVDVTDDNKTLVASGGNLALGTLPVLGGGTGSTTVAGARSSLDVVRLGLIAGIITITDSGRSLLESDRGKLLVFLNGDTNRAATLPDPTTLPTNWMTTIKKGDHGTGYLNINTPNSETIDGHDQIRIYEMSDQVTIASDGTNFHIIHIDVKPVVTVRTSGSGTHTFTPGRNYIEVIAVGAGGAGGGSANLSADDTASEGGGGGAGETIHAYFAIAGASASYQVGAGGTGDSGAGANGTNTVLTGYLTAIRGFGGTAGTAATNAIREGGAGGSAGGITNAIWSASFPGGGGGAGVVRNVIGGDGEIAFVNMNANGGASVYGASAAMVDDANQTNSNGIGAGGAGASAKHNIDNRTGGDGGDGILIIKEYY